MRVLPLSTRLVLSFVVATGAGGFGCTVGTGSEAVGKDEAPKIIGANDLTPVLRDGANIPEKYRATVDAFGLIEFEGGNHCTATHIGNGIAVTAGHCFHAPSTRKNDFACPGYAIGWGFRADKAAYLTSTCTSVIAAETNGTRDYAFFRVSPVPPVSVKPNLGARPEVGTSLTIFSHPYHRPLEWSQLCTLQPASAGGYGADEFSHQCDTEPASSGATVLDDAALTVVGIHNGGRAPWNFGTYMAATPVAEIVAAAPAPSTPPPTTLRTDLVE